FSAPTVEGLHRAIREVSPPTPMSLTSAIGRDLDTITMTALAKETNRRYATAADLAEDLARFRRGEPVMARRPGPLDQAWRWARRHPVAVAVMAVVAALLLLIGILSARVWTTWDDVEQQALAQRDREVESLVARGFREGRPEKGDAAIERARANFEAALELDPSRIDAAGGLLLTSYWSRPLEETAALLASRFGDIQDRPAIRMFDGLIKSRLATNDPEPIRLDLTSMQSAPAVEWFLIGRQIAGLGWELQDQEISRQSLEALTVAVATSPAPRFFFHNELCSSAWDSGEIETLGRFARAMVELWPEEPEGWFYQGCALHNRDLVRARAAYEKALSIDERQAGVWANLVSIHIREGRRELALDCARRAVAIDPQAGHAQQALAAALLELERPEEALEPARRALELIPRHVRARVVVVDALDALDRHDEAWATITEGLQLMPKNGEMQNLAGVHLMRTERVANAEAYFRQTTHWLPEFSAGWNNRVTALIALRRWAEAWEVSQVLRDKWPDDPRNWITSSILAYRLISARTAAEYLKRAASLRPDDADIAYRLAIALQHDGQPQQALEVVDAFADSGDPRLAGRREELILDAEHQALYRRWKAGEYELDDDPSTLQGIAFQAWALGDFEGASTIYLRIEDDFGVSAIPAIFAAPSLLGSTRDDPSSDQARDRRELALIVTMDLVDQGKSSPNPAMQGDLDGLVVALLHAPAFEFVRQGLGFRPDELARWSRFWVKARAVDEGLRSP
ncbi:MAG: tetratricopeptide repeat protein, partial [Planctomycetes bacterium]|nr:tetratricopeptide repeat protein [Planctomycetota bacterium]